MIAFVQCNNFVMLTNKEVLSMSEEEILERDCRVFNTKTLRLSPVATIGSWTCRVGPWQRVEPGTYTFGQIDKWLSQ